MKIIVSQEPIKLDGVACQYWYDNAWYNLQDFDNSGDFFMSTHADGKQYAAYDFCSLLSDLSSAKDICSDSNELKAFATIANYNNQADGTCNAASTDSSDSIKAK